MPVPEELPERESLTGEAEQAVPEGVETALPAIGGAVQGPAGTYVI